LSKSAGPFSGAPPYFGDNMNLRPDPPQDLQAVIFDLDGVIFDSMHCNIVLYNHILEKVGLPQTAAEAAEVIHRESMERSLAHFMGWGEKFQQAMAYWRELDATPFIKQLRLFPDVAETLERLRRDVRTAVATNRQRTTGAALDHFGLSDLFDLVVTPLDAGAPKPDPKVMEHTLTLLGLSRDQVVYVGDSSIDEALCLASDVRLVAYRGPELKAWAHVEDHSEIPALLGLE
jgi:phosphoglycolate phosphatase